MRLSKSYTTLNGGEHVESDVVSVTETIELDEREMERVVRQVAEGEFLMSASKMAAWEKIKEVGTLVNYEESTVDKSEFYHTGAN